MRNHTPQTGRAAKFSIEFAMASTLIAGRVGRAELTDAFVGRPDVQAMMDRVHVKTNTDYDPASPGGSRYDQVEIRMKSGKCIASEKVHRARGHAKRPLSDQELFANFEDCLGVGKSEMPARSLFERLHDLDHVSARTLTSLH